MVTDTLLPPNATAAERAIEAAAARISDVPVLVRQFRNPAQCPAVLLPWLADMYSVDAWRTEWTEAQKRQTILDSVFVHRHKGTVGAVRSALASLGIGARLQEWFNQTPAGAPYTYRLLLDVDQVGISKLQMESVQSIVDATKNLRSHLSSVNLTVTAKVGPVVASAVGVGSEIRVTRTAPDLDLLMHAAANGMAETEAAVDAINSLIHQRLPSIIGE